MKIHSKLTSLAEIVAESPDWRFNIPIYQRLYVWGEDQVLTLLNDLANAYERGGDIFFLGGTLLVNSTSKRVGVLTSSTGSSASRRSGCCVTPGARG